MKRNFFILSFLLFSFTCTLICSCSNVVKSNSSQLNVFLPYGSNAEGSSRFSRAASSASYTYKISFTYEDGNTTELTGSSGDVVSLEDAKAGTYEIAGYAYNSSGALCYTGTCTTAVRLGESVDVELSLYAVQNSSEDSGTNGNSATSESGHISVESCDEGVKITLNWCDGDDEWEGWSSVFETSSGLGMNFYPNESLKPSASNPSTSFIYPFTKKGETYKFKFSTNAVNGWLEEVVSCEAGGGIGEIFKTDSWSAVGPVINNTDFTFRITGDFQDLVSDTTNVTQINALTMLYAGIEDFSDSEFVCSTAWDLLYSADCTMLSSSPSIAVIDRYAKYLLGNFTEYDTYFITISILLKAKGNDVTFTTESHTDQADWVGERITFVQGSETIGDDGMWSKSYCCDEEAVDTLQVVTDNTVFDIDKAAFELTSDFDNDEFELCLMYNLSSSIVIQEGKTYSVEFTIAPYASDASMIGQSFDFMLKEFVSTENVVYTVGGKTEPITLEATSLTYTFEHTFIPSVDGGELSLGFYPFKAGKYAISGIVVRRED